MRITQARITNYRSVMDSGEFEVEKDKTILVGVNEAGKTALLQALQSIHAPSGTAPLDYLADYPRSKLNDIQRNLVDPSDVKVAQATFSLSDDDRAAISKHVTVDATATITWHRYLDNTLKYSLEEFPTIPAVGDANADATRLRAALAKVEDSEEVVAAFDAFLALPERRALDGSAAKSLRAALTEALPLVDEDDTKTMGWWNKLSNLAKVDTAIAAAVAELRARRPLLVYYSTYFTVRPRINLEALAARQAQGDIDDEYDFGNLCLLKLLGFTAQQLSDLAKGEPVKPHDYEINSASREAHDLAVTAHNRNLDDRQYRLNAASVQLTADLRKVWGDDALQLRLIADGQYLKVMVVDDIGVEVELDQRSEGFRWLVSFFVVFRAQAHDSLAGAILLLDEPGMSLHALKQQEFRKTVSQLGEDNQIIYTTHSPFMVGSDELDLVRIVEMTDRASGTQVHTRLQVDDPKSIFPLQAALGYELAQSMFSQKKNVVCEGVTDMFYLNAANEGAIDAGAASLKGSPAIIPAGAASKVAYFSTIYAGQNLDVVALFDSDSAGTQAAAQDALVALLPRKAILQVGNFLDPAVQHAEIEDLFRTTLGAVAATLGWDSTTTIAAQPTRSLMSILVAEHGKTVSKWKLAKAFSAWLSANGFAALQQHEKDAWEKLVAAINKALT